MKWGHYLILILVLVLAFSINNLYNTSRYPLHVDEYAHIAQAVDIVDKGRIENINPYFKDQPSHLRLESGFHVFLAFFSFTLKNDFILFFNHLKNVIFVINTFLIFLLAYKISKKFYIGIFSSIFFILLKSNLDLLGNLFLLPVNFSIFLVLLFFILFIDYLERQNKKYLYPIIIIFLTTLFVYPPAAVIIFLVSFLYLLFNLNTLKIKKYVLYLFPIIIISFIVAFFIFFWKESFVLTIKSLKNYLIFSSEWTPIRSTYSIFNFYGIIAAILALFGFVLSLFIKNKSNKLLIIWFAFCVFDVYLFYLFDNSLFLPFRRLFFYLLIGLCILSAFGLYYLLSIINKLLIKNKSISILVIVLILLLVFIVQSIGFYDNAKSVEFNKILADDSYAALKFLLDHHGQGNVIITEGFSAAAVYPVAKNHIIALVEGNLQGGERIFEKEFFNSNCSEKENINNNIFIAEFILTRRDLNCDFVEKIYDKNYKIYIFKEREKIRRYSDIRYERILEIKLENLKEYVKGKNKEDVYLANAYFEIAKTHYVLKDYKTSLEEFKTFSENFTDYPYMQWVYYRIAFNYYFLKDYRNAELYTKKSLDADKDFLLAKKLLDKISYINR